MAFAFVLYFCSNSVMEVFNILKFQPGLSNMKKQVLIEMKMNVRNV